MHQLLARLESLGSPRIVLVGDFMLDRWVYGTAERLSQEAPVPVLRKVRSETLTGGAGNVAEAITALGGGVLCVGVIGRDEPADQMTALLGACGAETSALVRLADRPTTVKTRYVGLAQHRHAQQLFRVDAECSDPMPETLQATLRAAVRGELADGKVLVIEDYNKGVLTDAGTPKLIAEARAAGAKVVVDPALIDNYARYRGATLLTPNRYETERASGIRITDEASLADAARRILLTTDADIIMVTLDKEGMFLLDRDGGARHAPTRPRAVYDITGAGDEAVAALAVALADGWSCDDAAALANEAGGLEVEQFGMVAVTKQEIVDELQRVIGMRDRKVLARAPLAREIKRRRRRGQTVVFTNGCFDLLHMGHVRYLQEARNLGSCLVVAINSDDSVKRLKGPARPIIDQDERAEMLAALEWVDYVTVFDEDTAEAVIEALRPDIFVKGGSTPVVVERDVVERYGGQVKTLGLVDGLSTTRIIERVLEAHDEKTRSSQIRSTNSEIRNRSE